MYIVGKVLKPQGIKGDLKIEIITSFPEHLAAMDTLYIKVRNGWQACEVDHIRLTDKFAIIKFKGITDRNEAEKLRDQFLYIPEDKLQTLGDDEFYIHDLIGLKAYDEEDRFVGVLVDVEVYASNDVYVLENEDKKRLMIPAVKNFIVKIDLSARRMIVRRAEELLDLVL